MTPNPQRPDRCGSLARVKGVHDCNLIAIACDLEPGHMTPHRWCFRVVTDHEQWHKSAWWNGSTVDEVRVDGMAFAR